MRKLALLLMGLMFLAACGQDLPPPPPSPGLAFGGVVGMAGAMPVWAAAPTNAVLTPSDAGYGDGIIISVSDYDYVYKNGYFFNSQRNIWERFSLEGVPVQDWLRQSGVATVPVSEQKFKAGENYVVVYACAKAGSQWDCNGNRWMLLKFDVKEPEKPTAQVTGVEQHIINQPILSFDLLSIGGEPDNFEEVLVTRYDARYRDQVEGTIVLVHAFEFDSRADLDHTMGTLFKDIVKYGWMAHAGQNLAMFLDEYDQRVAVWTSGKKIVYVETHNPEYGAKEIIEAYLKRYPSDLQRQ